MRSNNVLKPLLCVPDMESLNEQYVLIVPAGGSAPLYMSGLQARDYLLGRYPLEKYPVGTVPAVPPPPGMVVYTTTVATSPTATISAAPQSGSVPVPASSDTSVTAPEPVAVPASPGVTPIAVPASLPRPAAKKPTATRVVPLMSLSPPVFPAPVSLQPPSQPWLIPRMVVKSPRARATATGVSLATVTSSSTSIPMVRPLVTRTPRPAVSVSVHRPSVVHRLPIAKGASRSIVSLVPSTSSAPRVYGPPVAGPSGPLKRPAAPQAQRAQSTSAQPDVSGRLSSGEPSRKSKKELRKCCLCGQYTPQLKRHMTTEHLPPCASPDTTCWYCDKWKCQRIW
jgi:hypothetical protein